MRTEHGDRYRFEFTDVYVEAHRTSGKPTNEEAHEIYRTFWMRDENQPREDSNFVYLNVYDSEGRFKVQLYWDPKSQKIERSTREHY